VRRRLIDGSDFIKIVTEPRGHGGPAPDVVGSIVTAAHEARRVVVAHASHIESFKMSVAAGADIITHVPTRSPVAHGLARRTPAAIPTLTVSEALTGTMALPGSSYEVARDSVAALHRAGTPIAAGTDAVDAPNVPLSIPLGTSLHHELELLVEAGLTPVEALNAATSVPADLFGLDDRGSVAPGLRADLLLVDGDPTTDITSTRRIAGVWIDGVRYPTTDGISRDEPTASRG
ncbi:amidohydrolase family protein, partial [Promicromonospora sukumoe]|uniref:amidohydrolase family protein n=1 Tax=Promicromonospora sukumoe TaxID=88382 RepID=UPI0037C5B8E2